VMTLPGVEISAYDFTRFVPVTSVKYQASSSSTYQVYSSYPFIERGSDVALEAVSNVMHSPAPLQALPLPPISPLLRKTISPEVSGASSETHVANTCSSSVRMISPNLYASRIRLFGFSLFC
jgi:hypothetical protein